MTYLEKLGLLWYIGGLVVAVVVLTDGDSMTIPLIFVVASGILFLLGGNDK
jgi:hypothetical protein